ncbi:YqgE/AlgH family protein [Candidatus Symbiobacter mobilis]|uniref:UPF0301 protein Cenrod_1523 n=1 Tax=Candidatus Symbiobacter mobilis CR TaxID=946483 RepID=U5NBJ1_9BURK|nr:YqgE/AlgH family protein [Candidatus Symbiobacter mobilis]AGX87608.1 transcriptional regulator-like protein [Candidatus Symbiobacter mobilis CR]
MIADSVPTNLTNHFLIAMPSVQDEMFAHSVVYLCEHSRHGAMGLVINKPCDLSIKHLFEQVQLPLLRSDLVSSPVFVGGPVQIERGFVLHEPLFDLDDKPSESVFTSTLSVPGGLDMTTSKDILEALSTGSGPKKVLISLGYSAWGEGQLESELSENSWLTVVADRRLVFDTPVPLRWDAALQLLGLQAWMLSPDSGHA